MQFYSGRQFKKDNFTIPNIPEGYSLTLTKTQDSYGDSQKTWTIFKGTTSLISFKISPYDSRLSIKEANIPAIIQEGSNVELGQSQTSAGWVFLDDFYYQCNPPKLRQKGGKVFSKTFAALGSRLASSGYIKAKLTIKMLSYVTQYIKQQVKLEHPDLNENSFEFIRKCNDRLDLCRQGYAGFIYPTGELAARPDMYRTRQGNICLADNDNITNYGYRREDYHYTAYWLKEDEFLLNGTIVTLADGAEVCPDCGTTVPTSYMVADPDDGHRTCLKCSEDTYQIHNYSTRVPSILKFKAKKVTPSTIYLGCELEYETTDRDLARRKVGKALRNHAIMKGDGSIRNGFEVVTCPATLEIQLEVFKDFFANRPVELQIAANVGMHVHVSRKPLSVLTVGKMTEFMNRKDNIKFITHIAGRAPNNYCRQEESRSLSFPLVYQTGERYNTLNLNNKDTVEFRIFSTPLTYDDFAHKVQFCQALTEYCKPGVHNVPLKTQTYHEHFIKWALTNHKDFPELAAKLKSFSA